MRKNARSTAVKLIYGAIIVVFCFWGVGTMVGGDRVNVAAMVDDEPITAQAYTLAYERLQRTYRDIYREGFNAQVVAQLNLEQRALDELVTGMLLRKEADRLGLHVRDDEVRDSILNIPTFHDGGRFDRTRYLATLRASRITPTDFEEAQREALLVAKLESLITNGLYVSPQDVEALFNLESEKIDVAFVRVPYERFRNDVEVGDAEIAAHYEENQEAFRIPEKITLTYISYDPETFQSKVEVSDEAVAAYYDTHTIDFETPERVSLQHILIAMSPDADEATKTAARTTAEQVLSEASKEGADFAALAREHSDDLLSADAGGALGFVERGQLEDPLETAAFGLEAGTLGDTIVETPRGLHIIRVDEREATKTKPLDEVRGAIVSLLQERGADDAARAALIADTAAARAGTALESLATANGLEATTSDPTAAGEPLPNVTGPALLNSALPLETGEVGAWEGTTPPYYLFKLGAKAPSTIRPLDDARDRIVELLTREKTKKKAEAEAAGLLEAARNGDAVEALTRAAEVAGYSVDTTDPVRRNDSLTKLDRAPITAALFQLTEDAPVAPEPFILPNDAVAAVLSERIPGDPSELTDEKRDALRTTAMARQRNEALDAYRSLLRQRADISINPAVIN